MFGVRATRFIEALACCSGGRLTQVITPRPPEGAEERLAMKWMNPCAMFRMFTPIVYLAFSFGPAHAAGVLLPAAVTPGTSAAPGPGNLTLGSRSEGNLLTTINDGMIYGERATALRNLRVSEIRAKVTDVTGQIKAAIYSDKEGAADQLLRSSATINSPPNGWLKLPLTQPLDLVASSNYWLAIWSDSPGARVYSDAGGQSTRGEYGFEDWPDPVSLDAGTTAATLSLYTEGIPTDVTGPEMDVQSRNNPVADGSTTASLVNGTDFGGVNVAGGSRDSTFTLRNVGKTSLDLGGTPPVTVTGAQASDFSVTTQPASTVAAGGNTTFVVHFDPSAVGARTAMISVAHADSPANPFDFAVQGTGLGGGAGVLGNDSEGTAARNIDDTQIHGNRFQAPVGLRITELRAKVLELAGTFKCAVYSDTNGWADQLLRGSADVVDATNGWNSFPLTAPLDVQGGQFYWLVIWADTAGARVQFDPVGTAYFAPYTFADLGGQWPDPIRLTESSQTIDPPSRTYCIYAEGAPLGTAPGEEMDLKANNKLIVSGDSTPSTLDGTDFGSLDVASGKRDQTFTILNPGDAPLDLKLPIAITGPNASDFVVATPPVNPVPAGGSATFTLRFDPAARGLSTALVSIPNGDPDESPYQFAVQGAGFTSGRESIWPETKLGKQWVENTPYELGMVFRSSVAGKVTHLRMFAVAGESGDHIARLWRNSDETVIAGPFTWTFSGVNGWITYDIPDVSIDPDTDYTVSVSTGSVVRNYANIAGDVAHGGNNGLHLSYPDSAGVFSTVLDERPTSSYNGGNYLRDIVFVPAGVTVDLPDIDVRGNNVSIADGDQSPSTADATDFGTAQPGTGTVDRTFTILNGGTAPLTLSSTPKVTISAPQAAEFTVSTQPPGSVPPGGSTTFTVRFAPTAAGERKATVTIANDSDKNPFDFAIIGTGAASASLHITGFKPELTTGNVTLSWEGGGPQFQVERASAVNGPYQAIGAPQSTRTFTDTGALKSNTRLFYRIRQL